MACSAWILIHRKIVCMERMSSWSVKGRVPATAATGHQTFSENMVQTWSLEMGRLQNHECPSCWICLWMQKSETLCGDEEKTISLLGLDRVQRPPEKVQSRRNLPGRLHRWDLLQVRSQIKSIISIAHRSTVSKAEDIELNPFSRRGGGNCGGNWSFKNVLTFRL